MMSFDTATLTGRIARGLMDSDEWILLELSLDRTGTRGGVLCIRSTSTTARPPVETRFT